MRLLNFSSTGLEGYFISAVIVDPEKQVLNYMESQLLHCFPELSVIRKANNLEEGERLVRCFKPFLLFIGANWPGKCCTHFLKSLKGFYFYSIIMSDQKKQERPTLWEEPTAYLLKPINTEGFETFITSLKKFLVVYYLTLSKKSSGTILRDEVQKQTIGIPVLEGYIFLEISQIVRCEGVQKYTRLITLDGKNLLSSYNLGLYMNHLETFGFFSVHKSHLINLRYINHYSRDGILTMVDGSQVPVARRKREMFLSQIPCISKVKKC